MKSSHSCNPIRAITTASTGQPTALTRGQSPVKQSVMHINGNPMEPFKTPKSALNSQELKSNKQIQKIKKLWLAYAIFLSLVITLFMFTGGMWGDGLFFRPESFAWYPFLVAANVIVYKYACSVKGQSLIYKVFSVLFAIGVLYRILLPYLFFSLEWQSVIADIIIDTIYYVPQTYAVLKFSGWRIKIRNQRVRA